MDWHDESPRLECAERTRDRHLAALCVRVTAGLLRRKCDRADLPDRSSQVCGCTMFSVEMRALAWRFRVTCALSIYAAGARVLSRNGRLFDRCPAGNLSHGTASDIWTTAYARYSTARGQGAEIGWGRGGESRAGSWCDQGGQGVATCVQCVPVRAHRMRHVADANGGWGAGLALSDCIQLKREYI